MIKGVSIINRLPEYLIKELNKQYNKEEVDKILQGYASKRVVSLRVNTLKINVEDVCKILDENNIEFETMNWSDTALVIKKVKEDELKKLTIYENGDIYLQSLSSMLPSIILNPQENTDILDMTAAPGGKTTQIAAITNNNANITACEMNSVRAQRLKFNIDKQGATSVSILKEDSRKLSDYFAFDKILLDAPCSGSGTIRINDERTFKNFSEKLVQKSACSQILLLKKALKILKPEHEMVYSTCSILSTENEEIVNKVLKSENAQIVPIDITKINEIPLLSTKIKDTVCICPSKYYDGFFIAKIRKNK